MNYLREELNFTASLWRPKDLDKLGGWGRPAKKGSENSTWSGLVGMVQRGEMDMCVTAFSMTLSRYVKHFHREHHGL